MTPRLARFLLTLLATLGMAAPGALAVLPATGATATQATRPEAVQVTKPKAARDAKPMVARPATASAPVKVDVSQHESIPLI